MQYKGDEETKDGMLPGSITLCISNGTREVTGAIECEADLVAVSEVENRDGYALGKIVAMTDAGNGWVTAEITLWPAARPG